MSKAITCQVSHALNEAQKGKKFKDSNTTDISSLKPKNDLKRRYERDQRTYWRKHFLKLDFYQKLCKIHIHTVQPTSSVFFFFFFKY